MVTIALAFYAENKTAYENFQAWLLGYGETVVNNMGGPKENGSYEIFALSENPHRIFGLIEEWAEGISIPSELQDIHWETSAYWVHGIGAKTTRDTILELINFNVINACTMRSRLNRMRFELLDMQTAPSAPEPDQFDKQRIIEAINIISQKVLGQEILTIVNKQEEVKWPVH